MFVTLISVALTVASACSLFCRSAARAANREVVDFEGILEAEYLAIRLQIPVYE